MQSACRHNPREGCLIGDGQLADFEHRERLSIINECDGHKPSSIRSQFLTELMGNLEKLPAHLDVPSRSAAGDGTAGLRRPSMSVTTRSRRRQTPLAIIPVAEHHHATRSHRAPPSREIALGAEHHDAGASSRFRPCCLQLPVARLATTRFLFRHASDPLSLLHVARARKQEQRSLPLV
jgi:hypothetical protein